MATANAIIQAIIVIGIGTFLVTCFCLTINYISNLLRWKAEMTKIKFEEKKYELRARFGKDWQDKIKLLIELLGEE